MPVEDSPRMRALRVLLILDGVVLFLLGAVLIAMPARVEAAFHFTGLPAGVNYIIGLWGCALLTMAIGYLVAATEPLRHVVWVQVGIARGALECVFGIISVSRGVVTWEQAGFGIIIAGLVTMAYIALYPRSPGIPI